MRHKILIGLWATLALTTYSWAAEQNPQPTDMNPSPASNSDAPQQASSNSSKKASKKKACNDLRPVRFDPLFLIAPFEGCKVYAKALYLQPSGCDLNYIVESNPLPLSSPSWKIHKITPQYQVAFDVGFSAQCNGSNAYVNFNWEHFKSNNRISKNVKSENMLGPFFAVGPYSSIFKKVHGKVHTLYDSSNFDCGVFVHGSGRFTANMYAGINFTRIHQDLRTKFSNRDESISRSIHLPSKFMGAGPHFGIDFSYRTFAYWNITGRVATAILVGKQKNHTHFSTNSPTLTLVDASSPNHQYVTHHNKIQVVPAFEGKLGISYEYTRCNWTYEIEVGYQAKFYLNALQSIDIGSEIAKASILPSSTGVYASTLHRTTSNFALAGPYLTLNVSF